MRISTQQIFQQNLNQMLELGRQVAAAQARVSSGRKFATPADDPVAAGRIVRLNTVLAQRQQYRTNIDVARTHLGLEEAMLDQAGDLLARVREIAVQSGSGALTDADRRSLAVEVETRLAELVSLMNTRTPSGEYLFSGYRGTTEPFTLSSTEGIVYHGDEGQRRLQIDTSNFVPVSDSGKRIFMDVASADTTFTVAPHPDNDVQGKATILSVGVTDQAAVDALFPDDLLIEFRPLSEDPGGGPNFTIRRQSDGRPLPGLSNVPYEPGAEIEAAGMRFRLFGEPAPGDRFFVDTTERQSMVTTLERFASGLRTPLNAAADHEAFGALVAETLENLDFANESLLEVRTEIGARLNTLDSVESLHLDVELGAKEMRSKLRDVDFAAAISELTLTSTLLEAAQASFVRVNRLSLFNYL